MKVLVFGPSGAGKSYLSSKFREKGVNAVDGDLIEGLSHWYNWKKEVVEYPKGADEQFFANHEFLWDRKFLEEYLKKNPRVFIFGASGNIFEMLNLFDKVFFLKVDPDLQRERLIHESRENPIGQNEFQRENAVVWGLELEEKAKKRGIEFLDGSLFESEIYEKLKSYISTNE